MARPYAGSGTPTYPGAQSQNVASMTGPTEVVGPHYGAPRGRWIVPTVIGVVGACCSAASASSSACSRDETTTRWRRRPRCPTTDPSISTNPQAQPPQAPQLPPTPVPPPPGGGTPPLVMGADNSLSHENCDAGWSLTTASGWGTHSGRGSAETSCYFARSVLSSYWNEYGNASRTPRTVSAPGAVNCQTVAGASCDGPNFGICASGGWSSGGGVGCVHSSGLPAVFRPI